MGKSVLHFLVYGFGRVFLALLALLPFSTVCSLTRLIARVGYRVMGRRRRIARENLDRAFGDELSRDEKTRLAVASFESMAVSLVELLSVARMLPPAAERMQLEGREHLEQSFAQGHGVILAISHLGSWEYLSFLPYLTNHRWSVIVKAIRNPYFDRLINQSRRKMTVNPIHSSGSIKGVLRELKKNHGVGILIDQWAGEGGIWTEFFGCPTSTTSIPARLSVAMGSPILPAFCLRQGTGRYLIRILPAVVVDRAQPDWEHASMVKLNAILETQIRLHPEQWTWGHRRWKAKPPDLRVTTNRTEGSV